MADNTSHHATTDQVSQRVHETIDRLAERAAKAEERLRHDTATAEARVRNTGQQARERSEDMVHTVSGYVRDNPLTALGLAFAAGTLLSALTRRR